MKFADDVEKIKFSSLQNIKKLIDNGEKIIGYGAPAKATTILNYFGINESYFEYVLEDSQIKHNKFIPETNIQIRPRETINIDSYKYILVLAWNFSIQSLIIIKVNLKKLNLLNLNNNY